MNGDAVCAGEEPALREVGAKHWAACHHVENFADMPVTPPTTDSRRAAEVSR